MKKIFSVLTILILMLSLLPAASAKAESGFDLRLSADTAGEGWSWDQAARTLTLDGAELQSENGPVFRLPDGATVAVKDDSRLKAVKTDLPTNATFYAIHCEGALTLSGAGELAIESASGGIFAVGLTVGGRLTLATAVYGLYSDGDLAILPKAKVQCTLSGDEQKPEEAIALFCQKNLTLESEVTVRATNAACGIKGNTVTVRGTAKVDVTNDNQLETDALAKAGIYSVNAIAGTAGITLEGTPAVNASVTAIGCAECVMAGQSYESSSSEGDLILNGGELKVAASCSETAAFGVGGIRVALNGGKVEASVVGTEREDRISAAIVAGRYGGISVGEGMEVATPKGGYISSDGRTILNAAGETAAQVTVSGGENGVFQDVVSSRQEVIWLVACLVVLAAVAVISFLQRKKEREE